MEATSVPQTHERVLILDDEPSQLKTLTAILEEEGFYVLPCSRGAEALAALAQGDIAVAVVDLRLPDMGTRDLLNALMAWSDRVPIIINTAFASYVSARDAVNVGAFAYVEKAGNPADLVRHVHRAFQSRLRRHAEQLEQAVHARTRELAEANVALRKSEEKFRALFEHMAAGCCLEEIVYEDGKAVDYRILEVNPSFEQIIGIGKAQAVGALASKLYGLGAAPFLDIYAKVAETGEPASFESYFPPIGKHLHITASRPGKGGFSTVFSDITERKEQEQKILDYQRQLKALASELTLAEERLRRDVAARVHDDISQTLAMSKLQVETLCEAVSDDPLRAALAGIAGSLEQAIRDARALTAQLSYPTLTVLGLAKAVEKWLSEEVEAKHGLETVFEDDLEDKPLDDDTQAVLFRSVRELLTNVVKHAHATRMVVSMQRKADQIVTVIEDNGVGCDPEEMMTSSKGFGILSIRESLERLGGTLEIESQRGAGCKITMKCPLKLEAHLESEAKA